MMFVLTMRMLPKEMVTTISPALWLRTTALRPLVVVHLENSTAALHLNRKTIPPKSRGFMKVSDHI